VQRRCIVLLEEAVDDLRTGILLIFSIKAAFDQDASAYRNLVLGFEEIAEFRRHVQPGAQCIVDGFVRVALEGDAGFQLCIRSAVCYPSVDADAGDAHVARRTPHSRDL
jgi:hypothetical protein